MMTFLKTLLTPNKPALYALGLGALGVMAYAPFAVAPFMLASIIGLFYFWGQANSATEAIKTGLWYGLGLFGFGVSWLFSSMYFYSGVILPVAVLLTLAFVVFLALSIALGGWLVHRFKNPAHPGRNLVLLFPAVLLLSELVRATIFGGFPFLISGTSHVQTWLDGYAPIFGVWGVSLAVAVTAGLLLWLYQQRRWVLASVSLCLVWSIGGLLQSVEWVKPVGQPIDMALVQGNIPQQHKWLPEHFYPTLKTYIDLSQKHMDAEVIVWPETAVPAYFDVVEQGALKTFIKDVQLLQQDMLVGVIDGEPNGEAYYNALVNLRDPSARYHKKHLVVFSEYFPFNDVFAFVTGLFDIPFATFTHGKEEQAPLKLGGHYAGLSICYEMLFGAELAQQLPQANYLITVSNDAWFAHTFEPAQQLQEVQMRAIELGRDIARATNTGYSVIVDKQGAIKTQIPAYEAGVLRGEVQPYEGTTFFAEWKKLPILILLASFFGVLLGKRYFMRGLSPKTAMSDAGSGKSKK